MNKIQIPVKLRDYIELLQYEVFGYEDLLSTVTRDMHTMTDEEWQESLEYYETLYEEAKVQYNLAKKEIAKLYKLDTQKKCWYIDFRNSNIVMDCHKKSNIAQKNNISSSFSDQINRLYQNKDFNFRQNGVKSITFQVTDNCNMKCTYCYQHNKNNHIMDFNTAKQFIDMILDNNEKINSYIDYSQTLGCVIDFIGGEPWVAIDLIDQITNYFIGELFRRKHPWAIRFKISISSNGLLHFDSKVQEYIAKHNKHLSYSVSIDGDKNLHDTCRIDLNNQGTYDRAIAAVQDYRDTFNGIIGSKMTIAPDNVDKIYDAVISMILDSKYTNINLNCVYEEGWTNEHAIILYWQLHKLTDWLIENNLQNQIYLSIFSEHIGKPQPETINNNWCGGAGYMISIDYSGNIYPCQRYSATSVGNKQEPYAIGNVVDGVNILPEHKERITCLNNITRRSQSTDECFNCPISSGCSWCSAYNYEVFGTPNKRATFICCMHKARVLANIYYWNKLGKNYKIDFPKDWGIELIGEEEFNNIINMGGE